MTSENGNGITISRQWFNVVIGPLTVAVVLAMSAWGWSLQTGHADQANHLTRHDSEIGTLERDSERVLGKLDQILSELRK